MKFRTLAARFGTVLGTPVVHHTFETGAQVGYVKVVGGFMGVSRGDQVSRWEAKGLVFPKWSGIADQYDAGIASSRLQTSK